MPGRYQVRRSVSLRLGRHLLLEKLARRLGKPTSALVEQWIVERAQAAGIDVTPEEVQRERARRIDRRDDHERAVQSEGAARMQRLRSIGDDQ